MPLFNQKSGRLSLIKEIPFKLEKNIQNLCDNNLNDLFNLQFVKSEFSLNNFRIDTLAFDYQTNSFVIIEYKREKNFSVIDQGYAYLSLMLNNKADFILEFNENNTNNLKRNDIDWSQSRVIFVAPSFTDYQKQSINFKDLPIELWEIKQYENDILNLQQLKSTGAVESIKTISQNNEEIVSVNKEIQVYTEDYHVSYGSDEIKELYFKLKNLILNIDEGIILKPTKLYLAFINSTNFVDIQILKSTIKIWINLRINELENPKKEIVRDVSNIGHHGNGDYEIQISNDEYLEYIVSLIRESYKKNKH